MWQRHADGYADGPAGSQAGYPTRIWRNVCLVLADLPEQFGVVWYVTVDDYPVAMGKAKQDGGTAPHYPFHSPFSAMQIEMAITAALAAARKEGTLHPVKLSLPLP